MISFLQSNWMQLAVAGVAILLINGGPLLSLLGNIKLPSIGSAAKTQAGAIPSRREVLDDLDGAFAYFQSVNCTDGMNAINTAVQHAFAQHAPPATEAKA